MVLPEPPEPPYGFFVFFRAIASPSLSLHDGVSSSGVFANTWSTVYNK
jgi:hypothetical protein